MTFSVKAAGVWKVPTTVSVKNAGVWKTVTNGFVKSGGTWREFFTTAVARVLFPAPSARAIQAETNSFGIISVSIALQTNGQITGTNYEGGDWTTPITVGIGSSYYVRFTCTAGGNKTGAPLNTWLLLNVVRQVNIANTNSHASSFGTLTMELSTDGVTPIASATCSYAVGYVPI